MDLTFPLAAAPVWSTSQSRSPSGSPGPGSRPHLLATTYSRTAYGGRKAGLGGRMAQAVGHTTTHQSGQLLPCGGGVGQRPSSCRVQRSLLGRGHMPCSGALYKEHLSQVHAFRNWGSGRPGAGTEVRDHGSEYDRALSQTCCPGCVG